MGFGVANLLNKYLRPALISWDTYNGIEAGSLNVDVKVSETHRFSNEVTTQTMEDGSVIDEHVINNPMEISVQFEETNNTIMAGGLFGGASFGGLSFGPVNTFNVLKNLAEHKVPMTITTQHTIYDNMVIKNMPILHRAPYRNALQVACDMIQLNFSKDTVLSYKPRNTGTKKSASQNVNGGYQNTV